jgi:hypothetical protein
VPKGNSIINLGGLAKPATVLIEKISDAIGLMYEPRRMIKKAKAEAKADKIKALSRIELNEIEQRGVERLVHQQVRKQENIENITAKAITKLSADAKTEDLEEDWVAHFFDQCDNVSDEQMQSLWSSLLAGEASNPGTYSKRTVNCIASMDKKDANLFTSFCQFTWVIGSSRTTLIPLIFDVEYEIYTKQGIDFSALKHLDAIGLISFSPTNGYRRYNLPKKVIISYFGLPVPFHYEKDENNEMKTGKAIFTKTGKELFNICGAKMNQEYYEYVISELSKQNMTLSTILPNE